MVGAGSSPFSRVLPRSLASNVWVVAGTRAVVSRPDLWVEAVRMVKRLAVPGWWKQWPPIPLPPDDYLKFRLQTDRGDAQSQPDAQQLVAYLEWCKTNRSVLTGSSRGNSRAHRSAVR